MIKIKIALYCKMPDNNKLKKHDEHQILFYSDGHGSMLADGREYTVKKGTAVYISPQTVHRDFVKKSGLSYINIMFETDENIFTDNVIIATDNDHADMERDIRRIMTYKQLGDAKYDRICEYLCRALFEKLNITARMDHDERVVQKYKETIVENIAEADFTIEDFMDRQECTRSTVSRRVKRVTNGTVKQIMDKQKIEYAKQLLLNDEDDIINTETVAKMCGYSDQYYLARQFKQHTGMTMSEVKKKNESK